MDIEKGTRYSEIIGNFGEGLILSWLSRSGFEACLVDHTGLDVIAYHKASKRRLGFTVKSRTRISGRDKSSVNIFSFREGKDDRQKLMDACEAFGCQEAWIAVYVETVNSADLYLTSLKNYDMKYMSSKSRAIHDWKMGDKYTKMYGEDPDVKHVHMTFGTSRWDWTSSTP